MRHSARVVWTACLIGGIFLLQCHPKTPPLVRIGCLPRLDGTAWIGIVGADVCHEWLKTSSRQYRIIPLDWSFQAIDEDSARDNAYLYRYASRIRMDTVVIIQVDSIASDRYRISWQLLDTKGSGKSLTDTTCLHDLGKTIQKACSFFFSPSAPQTPKTEVEIPDPALAKARLALLLGDWKHAETLLLPLKGSWPDERLCLLWADLVSQKWTAGLRDPTQVDEILVCLDRIPGESRQKALAMARLLILKEAWGPAEARLEQVLAEDPHDAEALFWLSRFHPSRYRKFGYANRHSLLRKVLAINPACEKASLVLAEMAFYAHRFDTAERVYEAMLAIHPRSWEAWMGLGKLAMVRRDFPRVVRIYETLLTLRPLDPEICYNLGVVYFHEGRKHEAQAFFKKAIALGSIPDAYYYLGVIAEQTGEREEAIGWYRERLQRRRDSEDVFAEEAREGLLRLLPAQSSKTGLHEDNGR